jgi:hypothetical protein
MRELAFVFGLVAVLSGTGLRMMVPFEVTLMWASWIVAAGFVLGVPTALAATVLPRIPRPSVCYCRGPPSSKIAANSISTMGRPVPSHLQGEVRRATQKVDPRVDLIAPKDARKERRQTCLASGIEPMCRHLRETRGDDPVWILRRLLEDRPGLVAVEVVPQGSETGDLHPSARRDSERESHPRCPCLDG